MGTVHQYGLFKFKTDAVSRPTTPTASRSRAAIFGLDVISRNLFGARPGSSMGDFFGGSMSSHRRSRTTDSRNSTLTGTASTGGSSFSRFSRTSTTTAATSVMDDDDDTVLKQAESTTKARATRKRVRQDSSAEEVEEPKTRRGAKRRAVKKTAYVEIASKQTTKVSVLRPWSDPYPQVRHIEGYSFSGCTAF